MPVQMKLEIEEGGEKLTVTDADGSKAFAYGDAEPQPARTGPHREFAPQPSKTGGTPFAVEVRISPWKWTAGRGSSRRAVRERAASGSAGCPAQKAGGAAPVAHHRGARRRPAREPAARLPPRRTLRVRFERWEQVPERALDGWNISSCPLRRPTVCPGSGGQRPFELPRVMFRCAGSRTLPAALQPRRMRALPGYEVSNIAHLRLCRGSPMTGGLA